MQDVSEVSQTPECRNFLYVLNVQNIWGSIRISATKYLKWEQYEGMYLSVEWQPVT